MEEALLKKIDEISDEMISGIKRVVQIDSVQSEAKPGMPFGEGVNKALEEALKLARELGFETENVDHMVGIAKYGQILICYLTLYRSSRELVDKTLSIVVNEMNNAVICFDINN